MIQATSLGRWRIHKGHRPRVRSAKPWMGKSKKEKPMIMGTGLYRLPAGGRDERKRIKPLDLVMMEALACAESLKGRMA